MPFLLFLIAWALPAPVQEPSSDEPQELRPKEPIRDWKVEIQEKNAEGQPEIVARFEGKVATPLPDARMEIQGVRAVYYLAPETEGDPTRTLTLTAETGTLNEKTQILLLGKSVQASISSKKETTTIDADAALFERATHQLVFRDHVRVGGLGGAMQADCSEFRWDIQKERGWMIGTPLVNLRKENLEARATAMALMGTGLVVLTGRKTIVMTGKDALSATCDGDAILEQENNLLRLFENCRVRTSALLLRCDRLQIQAVPLPESGDAKGERETRMTAFGNIRAFRASDSLTLFADSLRYDSRDHYLHFRALPYVVAEAPGSCHYWGPTRVHESSGALDAVTGRLPNYSLIFPDQKRSAP